MPIKIHGKEYVTVAERLAFFNEKYSNGSIQTEVSTEGDNIVRCKALIIPDTDKPSRLFTGHAEERRDDGMINQTSAIENVETSAVGRALAMMGIGVEESVASAEEVSGAIQKGEKLTKAQATEPKVTYDTEQPTKTCPKCGKGHSGRYAKCLDCWKAERDRKYNAIGDAGIELTHQPD